MRYTKWILCTLAVMVLHPGLGRTNTDLPPEFKSLVPVYAQAQHIDTRYTRDSVTVRFAAQDAFERVATFYEASLKKSGWRISISDQGKKLAAVNERIKLSLTENLDPQGFLIHLYYPHGRE